MNRMLSLAGVAKSWWQDKLGRGNTGGAPAGQEKTLKDLMAEQGRDENGRKAALQPAEQKRPDQTSQVIFVAEFSYDNSNGLPSHRRVSVVGLNGLSFHGYCQQGSELQSFCWSKVRGLMKMVDSGEMMATDEVLARHG
ncbi:hypothetical protein KRX52_08790 [Pseudomonas sp. MAP12]|uniref:Uncharacterized protein n=1 Tax=Geopseudomonas aromaticivorans TaxID=2849492 RepID=A0ABS6MVX0_9GAMM|nr:hypothetical protein [Pseudomonas aromaticivorans]MBV2132895.1 hypothetical protein [Pseudomonas aromaticivorans]